MTLSASDDPPSQLPSPASLWIEETPTTCYPRLEEDVTVDVCVVGAGIAGLTAARRLIDYGLSVVVLEARRIAEGVTGHTTAKLTSQHGLIYNTLLNTRGARNGQYYAEANQAAIDAVDERIREHGIDCNFQRLPAYTYARDSERVDEVQEEARTAQKLGLPADFVKDPGLPYPVPGAVRFHDQAIFHPRAYLLGLADSINQDGGLIYEGTRAERIEDGDPCKVTAGSHVTTAENVIVATHFPFHDKGLYFARMHPKKSYILAARLNGDQPEGMHYDDSDPYFSVRPYAGKNQDLVLFAGEHHRTGTGREEERYEALEATVREHFSLEAITHRWSTQDFASYDKVPFVGPLAPQVTNVHVATGFGGWGMTNGVAAGRMLADAIAGDPPAWLAAFDPSRFTVREGLGDLASHNVGAAATLAKSQVRRVTGPRSADVEPGQGAIVYEGASPVALYRERDGSLIALDAKCTHMGCEITWNAGDRTWDCPCHGSRFSPQGDVIDGPAQTPLDPREPPE